MNRQLLQDIFRQPFNEQSWKELLINLFGAKEIRSTPAEIESDTNKQIKGYLFGELRSSDRYSIGLFAFEVGGHTNIELNRVGLRSLVKSYTRYEYDAALTVYYNDDQWRLSFICDLRGENTAPKRYTYVFGNEAESYRTAADRLIKLYDTNPTFEAIKDAFSVEQLSKDFFKEYKQQYSKFIAYIGDTKPNRDYVKKMLGRLVFLQFLQKKGWMGVPTTGDGWCGGDLQYLQNLVRRYEGNDRLLSDVLEVLFFDTLNTKRDGDIAPAILGDSIKIPYLNGGLFDRDSIDNKDIDFPYPYFVELMEFFSHYNFTIDENDPYDAEVGIDPEMLGHIFENLLEDNKDKGAFYTPKEIVQYMCRQSLIEYLQSKLGKNSALESFVNQHDVNDKFIIENATEIEGLLDNIKICDPAIGSGAFPMGILNEIFHCKIALDLTLNRAEVKKNIIQNSIYGVDIEQGAVDIARLRFWLSLVVEENEPQPLPNLDYKIMCGNSLLSRYALDTPIDEVFAQYNVGKRKEDHFTLEDYKSLVADYTNTSSKSQKADFRTKIEEIKRAFKTTLDTKQITKRITLQSKINSLRSDNLFGSATKAELKEAKELEKRLKIMLQNEFDIQNNRLYENAFEWRFEFPALLSDNGSFVGFDIVIGNPPYGATLTDKEKLIYKETYNLKTAETAILFIERGLSLLARDGVKSYIIPKSFSFASNYAKTRDYVEPYLVTLVDCGKAFDKVKLEACIVINTIGKYSKTYKNELFENNGFTLIGNIDKQTKSKFGFYLNGVSEASIALAEKILSNSIMLGSIAKNNRGELLQGKMIDNGNRCIIGGKEIDRYGIRGIKGKIISSTPVSDKAIIKTNSVLVQNIVAHITKPYPQIKIIGCIPTFRDCYITDTINQLCINEPYSNKYLWAILNSKLIGWYVYTFIFGKAIRTMHFDNAVTDRIPIAMGEQLPLIEIVDDILAIKQKDSQADTSALEAKIDKLVYSLYNLENADIQFIADK